MHSVKAAPSRIVREQPSVAPNNPVKLSDPPAVQDPIIPGDTATKPFHSGEVSGDRPASSANVPAAQT